MASFNPTAGYMPIRVPNVNVPQGYANVPRFVRPQQHINFMTQNGIMQGVHRNINGNSYVPTNMTNMITMNNMVNNPRLSQMRMQPAPIYKQSFIGRLITFVDYLGCDVPTNNLPIDIQYWKNVTQLFFSEDAVMKYTLFDDLGKTTRKFEFTHQLIPRFYQTFIESGVVKIQLVLGELKEKIVSIQGNNNQHQIDCPSASIEYHFGNGIQVAAPSRLAVRFNNTQKMTSFDLVTTNFTEYVPRNIIPSFAPDTVVVSQYGIPIKTLRCLEIAEGVEYMQDIIALTIKDQQTGPQQAFEMIKHNSQQTSSISNNQNPSQRMQAQLNGKKGIKNEPSNYNAPPTPNTNDLHAASTPATPTPVPTPTQTPSLTPSPLVSNVPTPHQKHSTKSPALSEQGLQGHKRLNNDNASKPPTKRRSTTNKTSPRKNA